MSVTAAGIVFTLCPGHAQIVSIWPGTAPGSETWTHKEWVAENTPLGTVVFNVVTPTLTAYLPERTKGTGTGTGVIIAPGGAFVALAVDLEGYNVARWLQERGIAAFVLKYRIVEKRQEGIPAMNMDTAGRYGIADGILAWAQDDAVALDPVVRFHDALRSAGHKPEVHIFGAGGHGFGTRKQGTSSDHWIDAFYYWLQAQGFTRPTGRPDR